jgi:predicted metal-dependent HD superfamily phosphohydrolase
MENGSLIDADLKKELSALYRSDQRHYHGLSHIEALLALAREYREILADPEAIDAAIWFHDAIYDSRAKDNEARSAALARQKLAGRIDTVRIDRIASMIEATATHQLPDFLQDGARLDAALFLDMDLAVLGASSEAFDAYEQAVRQEYGWVPEPAWITGRSAVLKNFLARPYVFNTRQFRARFEQQARANMERSLASLGQSGFSA